MKMIQDLAYDAFQSYRDGDRDGMRTAIDEIMSVDQLDAVDVAVRLWLDRAIVVIGAERFDNGTINLKVDMVADNSGDGTAVPPAMVGVQDISWAGNLFAAYVHGDIPAWRRLWDSIPAGRRYAYVERVLTTMATTALAYEEINQEEPCCKIHDPATVGDRIAKAHLN
jgi:hypothetical protein